MQHRAMYHADMDKDVRGLVVMAARQQDSSFKILHVGLKAHPVT